MTNATDWPMRNAVAACLLSALALGSPSARASAWDFAQATPAPAAPPVAAAPGAPTETGVAEARITDLRAKLRITAAQEAQFTALAGVMRANARSMETLLADHAKDSDASAVASLRWYERLTDAHAEALKAFVPAFEALYTVLSDSQRKAADAMFQQFATRQPHSHKSK